MEGKNNTPSWMPHLIAGLATVAATWGMIKTEVRTVVREEVRAELATQRPAMVDQMDSLFGAFQNNVDTMLEHRITVRADSIINAIGLIPVNQVDGPRIYRPNIVVQADTMLQHTILQRLDTLSEQFQDTRREVWKLKDERKIPNGKQTRWNIRKE